MNTNNKKLKVVTDHTGAKWTLYEYTQNNEKKYFMSSSTSRTTDLLVKKYHNFNFKFFKILSTKNCALLLGFWDQSIGLINPLSSIKEKWARLKVQNSPFIYQTNNEIDQSLISTAVTRPKQTQILLSTPNKKKLYCMSLDTSGVTRHYRYEVPIKPNFIVQSVCLIVDENKKGDSFFTESIGLVSVKKGNQNIILLLKKHFKIRDGYCKTGNKKPKEIHSLQSSKPVIFIPNSGCIDSQNNFAVVTKDHHILVSINSKIYQYSKKGLTSFSPKKHKMELLFENEKLQIIQHPISESERKVLLKYDKETNQWKQEQQIVPHTPVTSRSTAVTLKFFDPEKVKFIKKIGGGGFGVVWRCIDMNSNSCAVKVIEITDDGNSTIEMVEKELGSILSLSKKDKGNEMIIRFDGYGVKKTGYNIKFYIKMELADKGSIYKMYKDQSNLFEKHKCNLIRQTIKSIDFVHSNGYIHRDIKSENFLIVSKGGKFLVKLCDFGLTRKCETVVQTACMGCEPYYAPELGNTNTDKTSFSKKTDIYALGVLINEMYRKEYPSVPFYAAYIGRRNKICANVQLAIIVKQCWHHDPKKRPSTKQILSQFNKIEQF